MTKATALPITMFIFAMSALAADPTIEWTGAKDLNLDDVANWSGTFPADNFSYLSNTPDGDLTIAGSSFSLYRFWIRANASISLGSTKTFKMSSRLFVEGGSTVQVKSGTVGVEGDVFVGDSTANNLLVATGSETRIEAGALRAGTSANGNTIRIENGAQAEASQGVVGRKNARDNSIAVAGTGSDLRVAQLYIGNGEDSQESVHNGLVVSDGGCAVVSTSAVIGNYTQTRENYLQVVENGFFATSGNVIVGYNGSSNEVHVSAGGVFAMTNNNITIGTSATAVGNRMTIGSRGELHVRRTTEGFCDLYVGENGKDNVLRFDNGKLVRGADSESVRIMLGHSAESDGSRLEVLNGSSVDVSRLIVGDNGNNAKLILSNASLRVKGSVRGCQLSANPGLTGNDFLIFGPSAHFTAHKIDMGGNSKLVFNIPKEGFDDVPVQIDNEISRTNEESPEIVINPPSGVRKGGWHTLMRIGGSYDLVGCLENFTITAPQDVTVSVEKTELKVRYSSNAGMVLTFR